MDSVRTASRCGITTGLKLVLTFIGVLTLRSRSRHHEHHVRVVAERTREIGIRKALALDAGDPVSVLLEGVLITVPEG